MRYQNSIYTSYRELDLLRAEQRTYILRVNARIAMYRQKQLLSLMVIVVHGARAGQRFNLLLTVDVIHDAAPFFGFDANELIERNVVVASIGCDHQSLRSSRFHG